MAGSNPSAAVVVPWVCDLLRPRSAVDVGCGTGAWLRPFLDLGVEDILGFDGAWVPLADLEIPRDRFQATNLVDPPRPSRTFDLAISLEVAEHLPEKSAGALIATLTGFAPAVLFGASVPGQRGTNHINEQWPDYWARRFAARDYVALDIIRPRFWRDDALKWWYAQNTLLYVKRGHELTERLRSVAPSWPAEPPLAVVHPGMLAAVEDLHARDLEPRRLLARGLKDVRATIRQRLPGPASTTRT